MYFHSRENKRILIKAGGAPLLRLELAGGEGFEPSTPNLGGWCSIRTELLAHALLLESKQFCALSRSP